MAIAEESRKELYDRLEEALGRKEATTLMEHLPPVGWADVARRSDIGRLAGDVGHRFGLVDRRFEEIDRRFEEIDHRFEEVGRRFDAIDHRFDELDRRFDERLTPRIDSAIDRLHTELGREMRNYGLALITVNASITTMAVALTSVL